MIKLLRYLRPKDWFLIFIMIGFILLQVYFDTTVPTYSNNLYREMLNPAEVEGSIINIGITMLLYTFGGITCTIIVALIATYISVNYAKSIRMEIFKHINSLSLAEFNQFSAPSLLTRTTNDVTQIQMALMFTFRVIISSPATAIWAIVKINSSSMELTYAIVGVLGLMISFLLMILLIVVPKFKLIQTATDRLNNISRETITGLRVVKAFNAEEYQHEKFDKGNVNITKLNYFVNKIFAFMNPFMIFCFQAITLTFYWWGSYLINQHTLNLPTLMEFQMYGGQILSGFMMIAMVFFFVPRAQVSAKRINAVLDTKSSVKEFNTTDVNNNNDGSVVFNDVTFIYPDAKKPIVEDISFSVKKGETLAIIGSTGSGKSTIVNLIPRFYDVTKGNIIVDGVDIKDYSFEQLRRKIGYIPQNGMLFSGSIDSNVTFGQKERDEKLLNNALDIACASEFISGLPDGLESNVAQKGSNYSGGQKQRLAIARALAKNPEIVIFDDSFSALDYKTDKTVRSNLKEKLHDATIIIVAQRIGTIMDADKIVVLDKGRITGIGTHKELLVSNSVYKEIALSQLSEEELSMSSEITYGGANA